MAVVAPAAAFAAAQAGSIGAGFSGAGFILPFFLGVIDMLYRDLGVMNVDMPAAGASSGAIAVAAAVGAIPIDAMRSGVDSLGARCRAKGNCFGTLHEEVTRTARDLLTEAGAKRIMDHGRAHLTVMRLPPGSLSPWQEMVSNFTGREDIVDAVGATCYIPGYAGPSATIKFRGEYVFDGSLGGSGSGFLPCPPGVSYCVRVSSFPANVAVMDLIGQVLLGGTQNMAIVARTGFDVLTGSDAIGNLKKAMLGPSGDALEGTSQLVTAFAGFWQLRTPGEDGADIFPGRRHKLPVGTFEWASRLPIPAPSPADNQAMFDLGRAEALSWAQEAGFPAALAKGGAGR